MCSGTMIETNLIMFEYVQIEISQLIRKQTHTDHVDDLGVSSTPSCGK